MLEAKRQRARTLLQEQFASDEIDVDQYEQRVDRLEYVDDIDQLERLFDDFGLPREEASLVEVESKGGALVPTDEGRRTGQTILGIFSGPQRRGRWKPAQKIRAFSLFGGIKLDFREVDLPPGVTEIKAVAVLGGVDIIVPPGMPVDVEGVGILGDFDDRHGVFTEGDGRPSLRITGFALLGGVKVKTKKAKSA